MSKNIPVTNLNALRPDATPEELSELPEDINSKGELMTVTDQTFALRDGHYCVVAGYIFGPWPDKGAATAGMQVERRRIDRKRAKARGDI